MAQEIIQMDRLDVERYRQAMERIRACHNQLGEIAELRQMGHLALRNFRDRYEPLAKGNITRREK